MGAMGDDEPFAGESGLHDFNCSRQQHEKRNIDGARLEKISPASARRNLPIGRMRSI